MKKRECDGCGNQSSKKELGRKVNGDYLCKKCKVRIREEHRKKTIEDAGIGDELRELKNKHEREMGYSRKAYKKKVGRPVRSYGDYGEKEAPIPKGSKIKKRKEVNTLYLTIQEKQNYLRILMGRGLDFEEAKERIQDLVESQKNLREKMIKGNKSKEEINTMQKRLIEGLLK